jgi:hypothetical protein
MGAIRRAIEEDRFPRTPRLDPPRSALAKLGSKTPLPIRRWPRLTKNGDLRERTKPHSNSSVQQEETQGPRFDEGRRRSVSNE